MPRKLTRLNPNHPYNQMKRAGEKAKNAVRWMRNGQLTAFIEQDITDPERRALVLAMPRGQRIKYIVRATEQHFVNEWNEAQRKATEEAEKQKEDDGLEHTTCTLCSKEEAPGFFTGCMIRDTPPEAGVDFAGWTCDGSGNLTRPKTA